MFLLKEQTNYCQFSEDFMVAKDKTSVFSFLKEKKWNIGQDSRDEVVAQHLFISAELSIQLLHDGKLPTIYHHLLPACWGLVTQLTASAICSWIIVKDNKYLRTTKHHSLCLFFLPLPHTNLVNTLYGISLI